MPRLAQTPKKDQWKLVKKSLQSQFQYSYQTRQQRDKAKLNQVKVYAQSALCRWRSIQMYFNEVSQAENCDHCDNCLKLIRLNLDDIQPAQS